MSAPDSWKEAYRALIDTLVSMGYPDDFGKTIAKNLGYEKLMRRMAWEMMTRIDDGYFSAWFYAHNGWLLDLTNEKIFSAIRVIWACF